VKGERWLVDKEIFEATYELHTPSPDLTPLKNHEKDPGTNLQKRLQ